MNAVIVGPRLKLTKWGAHTNLIICQTAVQLLHCPGNNNLNGRHVSRATLGKRNIWLCGSANAPLVQIMYLFDEKKFAGIFSYFTAIFM